MGQSREILLDQEQPVKVDLDSEEEFLPEVPCHMDYQVSF